MMDSYLDTGEWRTSKRTGTSTEATGAGAWASTIRRSARALNRASRRARRSTPGRRGDGVGEGTGAGWGAGTGRDGTIPQRPRNQPATPTAALTRRATSSGPIATRPPIHQKDSEKGPAEDTGLTFGDGDVRDGGRRRGRGGGLSQVR